MPQTICKIPHREAAGADWAIDGTIFLGRMYSGISRVPATGGVPQAVTTLDKKKGERGHLYPQLLPGGKAVLFTVQGPDPWNYHVVVESLTTHKRWTLAEKGTHARYSSGGLIYAWGSSLFATPFDLTQLRVTGAEVPITGDLVAGGLDPFEASAPFAVSASGALVYAVGGTPSVGQTLVWVDRLGKATRLSAPTRYYNSARLSPDGKVLAVDIFDGSGRRDVWTYELKRDVLTRLTYDGTSDYPIWTPDGKSMVFSSRRAGPRNLFMQSADGGRPAEQLLVSENPQWPGSWSPDGRLLAFMDFNDTTVLSLQGERKLRLLVRSAFGDRISPDGRWLAYVSDETGRWEIYVTAFPSGMGKWQISIEGGSEVVWEKHGRELYYRQDDKLMTVSIDAKTNFTYSKPRPLFDDPYKRGGIGLPGYDVTNDGQHFVMIQGSGSEVAAAQIKVVLNWFEELKSRP